MYEEHFGLREPPFNNTPDPRFFQATQNHEEALACLIYAVEQRKGFVLLTGEVGAGKTLVTRMMLRHLGERASSAVITNTALGADDLMAAIGMEFGLRSSVTSSQSDRFSALQDFLLEQFAADRSAVLVLDEAQNLSDQALERVRMIGNLEADDAKLLQVVIVGQPELRGRLAAAGMRPLSQRIFRSFHLPALPLPDCGAYIRHRLSVAGAAQTDGDSASEHAGCVFDDGAVQAIARYSGGVPRLINTACDNALLSAYAADRQAIDGPFMRQVVSQLGSLPTQGIGAVENDASECACETERAICDASQGSAPAKTPADARDRDEQSMPTVAKPDNGQESRPKASSSPAGAQSHGNNQGPHSSRLARARQSYQQLIHHLADIQIHDNEQRGGDAGVPPNQVDQPMDPTSGGGDTATRLQQLLVRSRTSLDTLRTLVRQSSPDVPNPNEPTGPPIIIPTPSAAD
ncbi:MAG: ExeA family protein [Phycisphaerae bacterium]